MAIETCTMQTSFKCLWAYNYVSLVIYYSGHMWGSQGGAKGCHIANWQMISAKLYALGRNNGSNET